jgi:hypothetical protein
MEKDIIKWGLSIWCLLWVIFIIRTIPLLKYSIFWGMFFILGELLFLYVMSIITIEFWKE